MTEQIGKIKPTYLGDGVYADTDGFHIIIHTDRDTIYLDPEVFDLLKEYATRVWGITP